MPTHIWRRIGVLGAVCAGSLVAVSAAAAVTPGWECIPTTAGQSVVSGGTGSAPSCGAGTTAVLAPTYVASGVGGKPTVQFSGVNLQLLNGAGQTASTNGSGNLVLGYDQTPGAQTGSHNLVLGTGQSFTSYADLLGGETNVAKGAFEAVFGHSNSASGADSSITGGWSNKVNANYSSISGGSHNTATSRAASVSGGCGNLAGTGTVSVPALCSDNTNYANYFTSVSGGMGNQASGITTSISGGNANVADGNHGAWVGGGWSNLSHGSSTAVSGGDHNNGNGDNASVSGGTSDTAQGTASSILGGSNETADGDVSSILGGDDNATDGTGATVTGGQYNDAGALYSTVVGGCNNRTADANFGGTCDSPQSGVYTYDTLLGGFENFDSGFAAAILGGHEVGLTGNYTTYPAGP